MTEIIFWLSVGAIIGILAATLVVSLCKISAQADCRNEKIMRKLEASDKWQTREDYYGGDE